MCFHDSPGIPSTNCCPTKPHYNLLSKPMFCLKREASLQPSPRAQPLSALWHVSTCLPFFPLRASPAHHRGPTSQNWGRRDPGAQTALHINLPGPPAVHLSAAAPLLHWMCYSHTSIRTILKPPRAIGNLHGPCPILRVFICLLLYHCLPGPGSSTLQT